MAKIQVEVLTIILDRVNNTPVVLLREKGGSRVLPIWIGFFEAQAIYMATKGIMLERPMTHDLCSDTIVFLGGKLEEVHIYKLYEGTFYAHLVVKQNDKTINIDARPSDSVAIALRQSSPIFVEESIMKSNALSEPFSGSSKDLEEMLASLPDDAFGKYNM
ncbi:MAG: bifunctional nuclease family protein [Proteobacteria bacterium]|nr:bifunctional nuclease family protein [Pseudomonadota bacterium]